LKKAAKKESKSRHFGGFNNCICPNEQNNKFGFIAPFWREAMIRLWRSYEL
jgi:hypothetical protein